MFWCWDIEPNTLRTVLIFPEIFFKDFDNSGGTVGWPSDEGRKDIYSACLSEKYNDLRAIAAWGRNRVFNPKWYLSGRVHPQYC